MPKEPLYGFQGDPVSRNQLPSVVRRGDLVEITVGVDLLVHAIQHAPGNEELVIHDKTQLIGDIIGELDAELGEDGSTLITRMFDEAAVRAIEGGSAAVSFKGEEP